uniref:Syntaxin-5 n=1 Tax=Aceria tosichella TaxID=561515 RepID=A0A6G1SPS7_9ACAR
MRGRDRTAEFIATVNSKREKPQWIQQRQGANGATRQQIPNKLAIDPKYRELMRASQKCSLKIKDSIEKLERFTHLAKKRTVFDDGELNRLIREIRTDISETKSELDYLQSIGEPKQNHTGNIVTILRRKLANVTSNFKSTLEMRSRSVQQQTARHELFAGPIPSTSGTYQPNGPVVLDMGASRHLAQASSFHEQQQQQLQYPQQQQLQLQQQQQLVLDDRLDLSERADKMQIIESTIVELGTVFNQLATIVQDQGETITRIDMNISETTANVEAAHDALLRYFSSINSNRWLILKVFGVLFFFFIVFVVFAS